MKRKDFFVIILCFVLAVLVTIGTKMYASIDDSFPDNRNNEKSLVDQKVISYSGNENLVTKIYNSGKLIGIVSDKNYLDSLISKEYENYRDAFPDTNLMYSEDVYLVEEYNYGVFENVDDRIFDYLKNNNLLGINTTAIEFSDANGVYEIIYVSDIQNFYDARENFLLNFISDDTLTKIENSIPIGEPETYGSVEMSATIKETITSSMSVASPSEIFTTEEEIYDFLCYGRNKERQYYTIQEGDSIAAVGTYFGDMSARQVMMLNPGLISSTDQMLSPGTAVNVTYYTSPITIVVTRERLAQEYIYPETPEYIEDEELESGKTRIIQEEDFGLKNVLYTETWENGVYKSGKEVRAAVTKEPVQGVIAVGSKIVTYVGTGNFMWPLDMGKAVLTCGWGCYAGHTGTDLQNLNSLYGNIYAADSGVVVANTYDSIGGYWVKIDHNNGYQTYYGHMNRPGFVQVGENVSRGQIIGQIGMTGYATGPHIHFAIYVNGVITNVCHVMDCSIFN